LHLCSDTNDNFKFRFFFLSRTKKFLIPFFCKLGALNKSTICSLIFFWMATLQRVGGWICQSSNSHRGRNVCWRARLCCWVRRSGRDSRWRKLRLKLNQSNSAGAALEEMAVEDLEEMAVGDLEEVAAGDLEEVAVVLEEGEAAAAAAGAAVPAAAVPAAAVAVVDNRRPIPA
jgi:hypothetical protein